MHIHTDDQPARYALTMRGMTTDHADRESVSEAIFLEYGPDVLVPEGERRPTVHDYATGVTFEA